MNLTCTEAAAQPIQECVYISDQHLVNIRKCRGRLVILLTLLKPRLNLEHANEASTAGNLDNKIIIYKPL